MIRPRGYCTLRYKRPHPHASQPCILFAMRSKLATLFMLAVLPFFPSVPPASLPSVTSAAAQSSAGWRQPSMPSSGPIGSIGVARKFTSKASPSPASTPWCTRCGLTAIGVASGGASWSSPRVENARLLLLTAGVVVGVPAVAAVDAAAAVSSSAAAAAARARVAGIAATRALLATRVRAGAV